MQRVCEYISRICGVIMNFKIGITMLINCDASKALGLWYCLILQHVCFIKTNKSSELGVFQKIRVGMCISPPQALFRLGLFLGVDGTSVLSESVTLVLLTDYT